MNTRRNVHNLYLSINIQEHFSWKHLITQWQSTSNYHISRHDMSLAETPFPHEIVINSSYLPRQKKWSQTHDDSLIVFWYHLNDYYLCIAFHKYQLVIFKADASFIISFWLMREVLIKIFKISFFIITRRYWFVV